MEVPTSTKAWLIYLEGLLLLLLLIAPINCQPFRFHLLGLPGTRAGQGYDSCAYTMKIVNFCKAMHKDNVIYFYGVEGSILEGAIMVNTVPAIMFDQVYPDEATWIKKWVLLDELANDQLTLQDVFFNQTTTKLKENLLDGDIIIVTLGWDHEPIVRNFPDAISVEYGIGYQPDAAFTEYRVFESYAWLHYSYGSLGIHNRWKDSVIPAFFDTERFPFSSSHDNYFLYVGRIIEMKGIYIAAQVTKYIGARLVVIGPGDCETDLKEQGYDHIECLGNMGFDQRNQIMSKAKALFYPTIYVEPFGCAAVEAMLTGTPVISSDHGAFTETVVHGVTGFRCRTFNDYVKSALLIDKIDRHACRQWAIERYSLEKAHQRYTKYFQDISRMQYEAGTVSGLEFLGDLNGWYNTEEETWQDESWLEPK